MSESLGSAVLELDADAGPLNAALATAGSGTKARVGALAGQVSAIFGGGLATAAAVGFGAIVAGGAVAGKALFDLGQEFDKAYDTIRVGTGATGEELDGLKGDFKEVFGSIPVDMQDAAKTVADLNTRLGLTGPELQSVSKNVLELSRLTGADLNETIESTSRLFGDWGVSTDEMGPKLDELYRISQATGIGVDQLSRQMVAFGSPLRQLGFDFETAASMFARFEQEGVNTQTLMPGLKMALAQFSDPVGKAATVMEELGIAAGEPEAGLKATMKAVEEAGSVADANRIAIAIFGQRAGPDMAAAIREGRFELDELKDTMVNGEDTIEKAAADTNSLGENWQILTNRLKTKIEPAATFVFDKVNEGMEFIIQTLSDFSQGSTQTARDVQDALRALGDAFSFAWGVIQPVLTGIWEATKGAFKIVVSTVKAFVALFKGDWEGLWEAVQDILDGAWKVVKGAFKAMWSGLIAIVKGVVPKLLSLIKSLGGKIVDLLEDAWGKAKSAVSSAVGKIVDFVKALPGKILGALRGLGSSLASKAREFFRAMLDAIKAKAEEIVSFVKGLPGRIVGALGGLAAKMFGIGREAMTAFKDGLDSLRSGVLSVAEGIAEAAAAAAKKGLKAKSPSLLMIQLGHDAMEGLIIGMEGQLTAVEGEASRVAGAAAGAANMDLSPAAVAAPGVSVRFSGDASWLREFVDVQIDNDNRRQSGTERRGRRP